jgi:hypothetical protein
MFVSLLWEAQMTTKSEYAVTNLKRLIEVIEGGSEVINFGVTLGIGEPMTMDVNGSTYSSIVELRVELYKRPSGREAS